MENMASRMQRSAQLREDATRNGVEFLFIELNTALTFATLASQACDDKQKLLRNRANSRKAYDTLVSLSAKLTMEEDARGKIEEGMRRLKAELERLGEQFQSTTTTS